MARVAGLAYGREIRRVVGDMRAAILVAACWAVSCGLVHADAAAPRRPGEPPQARSSILRPTTIVVTPADAVAPPDRVVVYVAREHLQAILGQVDAATTGEGAASGASSTLRHVLAAVALAIALLSLPLLLGRKGTGPATAVLLLAGALATAWVATPAADIASPGGVRRTPPGPPRPNTQGTSVRGTPTLEISVKPGIVQPTVQLFYRRP
jgi:hypothetical protein